MSEEELRELQAELIDVQTSFRENLATVTHRITELGKQIMKMEDEREAAEDLAYLAGFNEPKEPKATFIDRVYKRILGL